MVYFHTYFVCQRLSKRYLLAGTIIANSRYYRSNLTANPNFTVVMNGNDVFLKDRYNVNTTIMFKGGVLEVSFSVQSLLSLECF